LLIVFVIYAAFTIFTLNRSDSINTNTSEVVDPSKEYLQNFVQLVIRSRMLVTNWVYLQSNTKDKEDLKELHQVEYPGLKEELNNLMISWLDGQQQTMDSAFTQFENILDDQQVIMNELVTFEDYEDPMNRFKSEDAIESVIIPKTNDLLLQLRKLLGTKEKEAQAAKTTLTESFDNLRRLTFISGLLIVLAGLGGAFVLARSITRPVNRIKRIISELADGNLPEEGISGNSRDEIGQMGSAVEKLVTGLKETTYFAEGIGNGQYDSSYTPLSEKDVLGNALIEMRDNLKKVSEEDKRRNWTTEGLAQFGDTLRKNNDNISLLSDEIISSLVKYMDANQGGLFILNNDNDDDQYLELAACYAWDQKKYLEQKVYEGDGLTGQAWMEKESIYLTEVPDNYISITSGLGHANPTSVLIVPLKVNEEIYGVIELASFYEIPDYRREFVEKLAESIASTISSVKINERTQRLLEESTELTEQMRAQEEEMRQNMEELQATQEEMQRTTRDREEKENIINKTNMVIEVDRDFNLIHFNEVAAETLHYELSQLTGKSFESIIATKENWKRATTSLTNGKPWNGVLKIADKQGNNILVRVSAGPAHDAMNNANRYLFFAMDITNIVV